MELSNLYETCCSLLCQHPCCWSAINRIERSIPRKAASVGKLDAVNYDNSRDGENNKEKDEGKGRKEGNVFDRGMIITGPAVCDLLKSFPLCSEPFYPIDANSERRHNKYGLYTHIDSQESLRFHVPKCPPGSEEKLSIQSSEENKVPEVHIVQAFIIDGNPNSVSQPQYVWIPTKKKETKENVFSGRQMPSTQTFEASQVLECDEKQRKNGLADVCDDWSTWMSSPKCKHKINKCRYKTIAGVERHKTISSESGFKFGSGSSHQRASEHLMGKKGVKGDLLLTKGLSADSRIFWNLNSLTGSATNKRCRYTLESSQASSPDAFFWNGVYNFQKRFKTEFGTKNNESVKLPTFEVPRGKMATISLELGSKDKHPFTQPVNSQKKRLDFSFVPANPTTGNLPILLKEQKEHPNKAAFEEEKQKESTVEPGKICDNKQENAVSVKDRRRQKKERLEDMTRCTYQAPQRVSFVETIDTENWCHVEAMPLHRVRIPNAPAATPSRKQPGCSGKKMHGHISSKRQPVAAMTSHQRATPCPSIEPPKAFSTERAEKDEESADKVDFHDLPKPPPPSPQMLSNFNRSPSPHQLFGPNRSGSENLLEKPKSVSYLDPAGNCKPWP